MDLISPVVRLSACGYQQIGTCGGSWALTTLLVIVSGALVFAALKVSSYYVAAKKKL